MYVEDLKRGPDKDIGPIYIFEMASNNMILQHGLTAEAMGAEKPEKKKVTAMPLGGMDDYMYGYKI